MLERDLSEGAGLVHIVDRSFSSSFYFTELVHIVDRSSFSSFSFTELGAGFVHIVDKHT